MQGIRMDSLVPASLFLRRSGSGWSTDVEEWLSLTVLGCLVERCGTWSYHYDFTKSWSSSRVDIRACAAGFRGFGYRLQWSRSLVV